MAIAPSPKIKAPPSTGTKAPPPSLPLEKGEGQIALRTNLVASDIAIASRESSLPFVKGEVRRGCPYRLSL